MPPAGHAVPSPLRRRTVVPRGKSFLSSVVTTAVAVACARSLRPAGAAWIDPDTPSEFHSTASFVDGSKYRLVMSDEFNVDGRTFTDGDDPAWTALDKHDDIMDNSGFGSLHYYNSSAVSTAGGYLNIAARIGKTTWLSQDPVNKTIHEESRNYVSGMLQGWNKFCFTGGIVEVEVVLPGNPHIGGLWPAVWLLGNLGRATYMASTNRVWPWSYNKCDREKQPAQELSACNVDSHYGLHKNQGRGSTEIDIIESMSGKVGEIPETDPPISNPYADMTLQSAPGITVRRPTEGHLPARVETTGEYGYPMSLPQNWYEGLIYGNETSMNPYFYGTYLAPTKPEEPVQRSKKQAYQADALAAMFQLFPQHFRKTHKFRLEWQPGRDGRIDWYGQVPSKDDAAPPEWIHGYTIHDEFVRNQTGAQIPAEPSYLIMNIALSSNWGFPYDIKPTCKRCYDCDNPRCACALQPGFCDMMRSGNADMLIDSVRVYQNDDDSAHVGEPHTLGCDPPNYPTREFIAGHSYRYMRRWPGYDDRKPMKKIVVGGGSCEDDADCGTLHRGQCVPDAYRGLFAARGSKSRNTCVCEDGFVGPRCLTISYKDDAPGAYEIKQEQNSLATVAEVYLPMPLLLSFLCIVIMFTASMAWQIYCRKMPIKYNKDGDIIPMSPFLKRPQFRPTGDENDDERVTLITGRSV